MNNNTDLVQNDKIKNSDIISNSNLPKLEKQKLTIQVLSNEISLMNKAKERHSESTQAYEDVSFFISGVSALNQKGIIAGQKTEAKTGSGKIEIQVRGGDSKLILSILSILGVVVIAVLLILSWHK